MPFGSDTVAAIAAKNSAVTDEVASWRQLATSHRLPRRHLRPPGRART
jgi:hypothetical protein